ncbi:tetratricopeptide repeat protein [Candidatus Poribacteria bacterium]|nr:tetratricopeptide repeat protein [Candidatus Poribacteria bacterium]
MNHKSAVEDYNQGLEFVKQGMWDNAIAIFKKVIEEDPKHANSYIMLGRAYLHKGETYLARDCWRSALKIDPDNAKAKQYLLETDPESVWKSARKFFWPGFIAILILALVLINSLIVMRYINMDEKPPVNITRQQMKAQETLPTETETIPEQPVQIHEEPELIFEPEQEPKPTEELIPELPDVQNDTQLQGVYDKALADCLSSEYAAAIPEFKRILEYGKKHHLKDNAQYWLAECYYAQKEYVQALIEFQKVKQNFPEADKVFDAELKIAYSYYKLERNEAGKHKVKQLMKEWTQDIHKKKIADLEAKVESGTIKD